ncbi:MAG: DNA replication/repair protein RecF [bacterium]
MPMYLASLTLRQFRNYTDVSFTLHPGLNVIVGENAAGKTNILEAVFFLATLHTHRTQNNKELIHHGEQGMFLQGSFIDTPPHEVQIKMYQNGKKEVLLNSKKCSKQTEIMGIIPVVWFSPDDLRLVKGEPNMRRRWINFILSQTIPGYAKVLKRYHKALMERNAALKNIQEGKLSENMLSVWDEELAKSGVTLISFRHALIKDMQSFLHTTHDALSDGKEILKVIYKPSISTEISPDPYTSFITYLQNHRHAEKLMCTTLGGPHRDELEFLINEKSVRSFGSQGQQRSVVLSLKLSEIEYIKKKLKLHPIGLFDDVLSELDDNRSRRFWEILCAQNPDTQGSNVLGIQCLLTAVKAPAYISQVHNPHWIPVSQ